MVNSRHKMYTCLLECWKIRRGVSGGGGGGRGYKI